MMVAEVTMRIIWCALCVLAIAGHAVAQPGQTSPQGAPPPAPAPPPYPAPQPYPPPGSVPPPYGYAPTTLSSEERSLLEHGVIPDEQIIGGGLLAMFVGCGTGQAVQGRFTDTGYIFLLGEGLS